MGKLSLRALVASILLVAALSSCGSGSSDLLGRWHPIAVHRNAPAEGFDLSSTFVEFNEDGRWTANDGCHDLEGSYELEDSGRLTSTAESFAGEGCSSGEVSFDSLLTEAASVKFSDDGQRAKFLAKSGAVLLELRREAAK